MKKAGWGWCTPLIPGIRREKQADLLSLREARPADSKFLQDRTGYTENHVSKGKERKRKEKSKINNNKIIIKEKNNQLGGGGTCLESQHSEAEADRLL